MSGRLHVGGLGRGGLLLLATILVAACAPATRPAPMPVPGHQPGAEAEVLAAMDRYVRAISTNDFATMQAMQTPEGMTYRALMRPGDSVVVSARSTASLSDPARAGARPVRERYWSPTVLVRGAIAVVWAPYEFWVDGRTSHCGVDVFDFVRVGGTWRVANAMWTVEPTACEALRPDDRGAIRPADQP